MMILESQNLFPFSRLNRFLVFGFLLAGFRCTWRQLFLFNVDRPVIDLAWKIADGVLYTADRLASFGYYLQLSCFCNSAPETIDHFFFHFPLA